MKPLKHVYPQWVASGLPGDDGRMVWTGRMRTVSARRARKLRKRGVPLMPLHAVQVIEVVGPARQRWAPTTPNGRARYAWFVS